MVRLGSVERAYVWDTECPIASPPVSFSPARPDRRDHEMAERKNDFISSDWIEPEHEMVLVDGVWKQVVKRTPPSSSRGAGRDLPRSMREKKEREAAEQAAKEAEEAAAAEEAGEEDAPADSDAPAEGSEEAAPADQAGPAVEDDENSD